MFEDISTDIQNFPIYMHFDAHEICESLSWLRFVSTFYRSDCICSFCESKDPRLEMSGRGNSSVFSIIDRDDMT